MTLPGARGLDPSPPPPTWSFVIRARPTILALALVATVWGCAAQRGGDARRVVIGDPAALAVVPSLEDLRGRLVAFLAGVEGTSGVLELVAARYGIDLASTDGLRATGVDAAASFVAATEGGVLVVAVGVSHDERFLTLVRERAERLAGGRVQPAAGRGDPHLVDGPATPDGAATWRAAYGVTNDHIGLVVIGPAAADVAAAWRRHAAGDGAALGSERATRAREVAGPDATAWGLLADAPLPVPDGLGLLGTLVGPPIRGLAAWSFGVRVAPDRLSLRATVDQVGDATLPITWLRPAGPADVFAPVFPKTTTALLRGRFDVERVRKIPSILRRRFMPTTLPGTAGLPLPGLEDIVDFVEGDFAIGLLGVDPEATVQHLLAVSRNPQVFTRVFRLALGARLRDADRAHGAFAAIAAQLSTTGWTVGALTGGGYRGFTFHRNADAFSALVGHGVVLFISGRGEVEPFIAVAEERALALSASAEGEPVVARALGLAPTPTPTTVGLLFGFTRLTRALALSASAEGEPVVARALGLAPNPSPTTVGLVFGFTRLTRELADKGVPPYFLKVMNDLRVLAATADVDATRVTFELEVAL